jgi:putative ABC transport system permease protein
MAWRDSRRSRGKLVLFSSSVILGIAAMVAIGMFGRNVENAIEEQSKGLLGADIQFESRRAFTEEQTAFIDELSGVQSDQILFSSMVLFPKTEDTRLAQVRAITGDFPYYGEIETEPANGWQRFLNGEGAVVESSLLNTFQSSVGDSIKVGESTFKIVGALKKIPGDNVFFSAVAPRVYIRQAVLEDTGLMGATSLARYRRYLKLDSEEAVQAAVDRIDAVREELELRYDTVEERQRELGDSLGNLYRFLNLVGFVALLLGSIGIAGALQTHIRQRLGSVAILRCLGAATADTFSIFLIQGAALGLIGALGGVLVGITVVQVLPLVFEDLLPLDVDFQIYWTPAIVGGCVGFVIAFLFSLMPLLQVRRVSPLAVLRAITVKSSRMDPWLLFVYVLIVASIVGFAILQS